jgi:hypothetical protein
MAQSGPKVVEKIVIVYNDGSEAIISKKAEDPRHPVRETDAVRDLETFLGIPIQEERNAQKIGHAKATRKMAEIKKCAEKLMRKISKK